MSYVVHNLQSVHSSSSFLTRFRMWLPDEQSRWGGNRLVHLMGKIKIRIPTGLTFAILAGIYTLKGKRQASQVIRWPAAFGHHLTPTTVLSKLNNGIWTPNAVRVFISRNLDITYSIIVNDGQRPMAVGRRIILTRKKEVFHHQLVIASAYQNCHLASRLLENAIALYVELDITAVRLTAGLVGRGMVWPKFGFRPASDREWKKIHGRIRQNLSRLDAELRTRFENDTGEPIESFVENLLASGGPKSIWGVSDLDDNWRSVSNPRLGLGSFLWGPSSC